jgi:NTE family protein
MRRARFFFCLFAVCSLAWSQQPKPRPKVAVALQGGGAKGLAHIGVLQWFEEHHIPVDFVAGTSMGGLIGGLYATAYSPTEIRDIVQNVDWGSVLSGAIPYPDLAFRRKEDLRAFPNGLELGLKNGVQPPGGLNSGQAVRFIIDRYVLPYSDVKTFDALPIPFRCVATDLVSGEPVVFRSGSLPDALRATMSIPGVFSPVKQDGKILADGGLLNNLPTDVARQMGADVVIGVHLSTGPVAPQNLTSMFQVAGGSTDVMIDANELRGMEGADILITIDLAGYTTLDFSRVQEIIPKGYSAAQSRSGVLERLVLDDDDWLHYLANRNSRRISRTPVPTFVEVKGTSPDITKDMEQQLTTFANQPPDPSKLQQKLTQAVGLGRFNSLSYSLTTRGNQTGLLINVEEKDYAPPWLKPGFTIDGSDPNNVQFTLGARLIFLDIGGYRSELRTDFAFGSLYSISTEYYHPLYATSRWFVAPAISASRSPINLYFNDTFLAEYKLNNFTGGFDLGYAFNRFSELRFGYEAGYLKASRWIGSPLLPSVSGRTGLTRGRFALDRLDNPVIPRKGVALLVNAGWQDAYPGSKTGFPSGEATFEAFHQLSNPASLYFTAAGGTTFGEHQSGLPLFSLGGPSRLAAYGLNQFLTNQYFYFRGGYLHRLTEMPAFLGSGIFLDAHYELAKPYGLPNAPTLPNDGVVGVIMQTIFGPVLVGGSIGNEGHRKWFFQLGRVF